MIVIKGQDGCGSMTLGRVGFTVSSEVLDDVSARMFVHTCYLVMIVIRGQNKYGRLNQARASSIVPGKVPVEEKARM